MAKNREEYISALKYDFLTPFYDGVLRLTMRESTFKNSLIEQARIGSGERVLDLGCGTATLTLMIKRAHPNAEAIGLDGDPKILKIANAKADRAHLKIGLNEGLSFDLPYADDSFDKTLSSLFFHHLTRDQKFLTFREVYRILRSGGELHIADWGKPQNIFMRHAFRLVQALDGIETTSDNANGLLPKIMKEAGFKDVRETAQFMTMFGTIALYCASK